MKYLQATKPYLLKQNKKVCVFMMIPVNNNNNNKTYIAPISIRLFSSALPGYVHTSTAFSL